MIPARILIVEDELALLRGLKDTSPPNSGRSLRRATAKPVSTSPWRRTPI